MKRREFEEDQQNLLKPEEIVDENSNLIKNEKPNYLAEKLQQLFGVHLLKDLSFVNISAGIALIYTVSINFSLLFPYYLRETAGLSRLDTALAMTVLASGDVLSRLTVPILTDRLKVSARVTLLYGLIFLIIVRSILAESDSRNQVLAFSFAFGYVRATTVVNQNLCLAEYCEDHRLLSSALGLTMILKAIAVITVGQLLGYMRDLTNSYTTSLHMQNVALVVVVICWSSELVYKGTRKKSERFEEL